MVSQCKKAAAVLISVLCAALNLAIALQFFSLWRTSKRETGTETESISGGWARGVEALEGLAATYFLTATAANVVGLVGIVRRNPRCVRFWRDFSIADFACTTATTVFAVYVSTRYYDLRNGLCEELSRHDDVLMDLAEMGITLENCEQWSQRVVFTLVSLLITLHLIRLYLVMTVSKIFARTSHHSRRASSLQHVYLLPSLSTAVSEMSSVEEGAAAMPAIVYAPIPLSQLSKLDARHLSAREAWISSAPIGMSVARAQSCASPGQIRLPIVPGEGLHPSSREK